MIRYPPNENYVSVPWRVEDGFQALNVQPSHLGLVHAFRSIDQDQEDRAELGARVLPRFAPINALVISALLPTGFPSNAARKSRTTNFTDSISDTTVATCSAGMEDGASHDVAEVVRFVLTRPRNHRILETAFRPMTEPSWG